MKKILLLLCVISIIACKKADKSSSLDKKTEQPAYEDLEEISERSADSALATIDLEVAKSINKESEDLAKAKKIIFEASHWLKLAVKGEIDKESANSKIDPLMEEYNILLKRLSETDRNIVTEYHQNQMEDLIDLQIKYNK